MNSRNSNKQFKRDVSLELELNRNLSGKRVSIISHSHLFDHKSQSPVTKLICIRIKEKKIDFP